MRFCSTALHCPFCDEQGSIQVWRKREKGTGWELVDSQSNQDEKVAIQEYVRRQEQHTQSVVRQRHSIAIKQITMIFSRLSDDIVSHEQYLSEIVQSFKADPSAGAMKVRSPHPVFVLLTRCVARDSAQR